MKNVESQANSSTPLPGNVHTVNTLANFEPGLCVGGIRWDIFKNRDELIEYGAIFYMGKKLLIDRNRYLDWLKKHQPLSF